jgi:N-methylhydantoinase A
VPEFFLGGRLRLEKERAYRAFSSLARKHGFGVEELALGAITIVNTNMEQAIKKVSVERGLDPADFTLVCFGGAWGLHATSLAERLRIKEVLIPRLSGVLSALGLLMARPSFDFSQAVFLTGEKVAFEYLLPLLEELAERAFAEVARYGYRREDLRAEAEIDLRYEGQSYELTIPFTADFKEQFHALHQRLYGYSMPLASLEVTAVRLNLATDPPPLTLPRVEGKKKEPIFSQEVFLADGKKLNVPVYRWELLSPGAYLRGPLLLVGDYATVWVEPHWEAALDDYGNIWLSCG